MTSESRDGSGPTAEQRQALHDLAAVWPDEGGRNFAYQHLCGGLLRGGVPQDTAEQMVAALAEVTHDDQPPKRVARVADTVAALAAKKKVTGWPKLSELLGPKGDAAILRLRKALGQVVDLEMLAAAKKLPVEFLKKQGLHDLPGGGVGIPYADSAGRHVAVKKRTALKASAGSYWPVGTPLEIYGAWRLDSVTEAGHVILAEGESDCWAAWFHDYPCLGIPGAEAVAKTLYLGYIATLPQIYVVEENDAGGKTFVANVARRLIEIGWRGRARVLRLPTKDLSALRLEFQDQTEFRRRLDGIMDSAPPLPPPEPGPSVGSVGRSPRYRPLPKSQPFPVASLPPIMADLAIQGAAAIGCDVGLVAPPLLAAAAGCIGNSRAVLLKMGWIEPCIVWALTVADSGKHKSPAYNVAVNPLTSLQLDTYDDHRTAVEEYEREVEEWEAKERDTRGVKPKLPPEPPSFVTADCTIEALAGLLNANGRGVLVARDELDAWFKSFTRFKGKDGGSDRAQWLELHQAGTLIVNRKTGEPKRLAVRRASVSITGTIQPSVLAQALNQDALQAGLGARFLLSMPPSRRKVWTDDVVSEALVERYSGLLKALLALSPQDPKKRKPYILGLCRPAHELWVGFFNEWGGVQDSAEGEQAAAFAKIEAYAPRLMLLHHVVSHIAAGVDDVTSIKEKSAHAGIELVRWFADEAVRVYALLHESDEERQTRRLVEWIAARGGRVTARDLQRANSRRWPSCDLAEQALNDLVLAGLGIWQEGLVPERGGHRLRWFVIINPTPDTSDTRPSDDGNDGDETPDPPSDTRSDTRPDATAADPWEMNGKHDSTTAYSETRKPADERVSEVSGVGLESEESESPSETQGPSDRVSEPSVGPSVGQAHRLIDDAEGLEWVIASLLDAGRVGLDVETTGLDPRTDRTRLLSLAIPEIGGPPSVYLVDCFAVDPAPLWEPLADNQLLTHNGTFDLQFLAKIGFQPAKVRDTMLMSLVLDGPRRPKGYHTLQECVQRHLGRDLPKELQRSDWSGNLSAGQLHYAALDAAVLVDLHAILESKVGEAGLDLVADLESRCLPALAWMASRGVGFDREAWSALAAEAKTEAQRLAEKLDRLAPKPEQPEMFSSGWNWDSPQHVKAVFALLGITLEKTDDDALAAVDHPLAGLIRQYRSAAKRASTYGIAWLKHVADDGRVYAGWHQIGADSGRMACSKPNLQNPPKDERYRRCFIAPPGRVLVIADYSQIELRIAAKITRDKRMLEAYRKGDDLHTLTAQQVTGKATITKDDRKLAKAVNFGLLYGQGAKGFRIYARSNYGLELSLDEAERYRSAFFRAYPGLKRWHRSMPDGEIETRTLTGRRRSGVRRFTEKLNTPVQGTGADGLKQAMALLWERRDQVPGAFPVLTVHDEIVVECDADQAEAVSAWLKQAMLDGTAPLIDPVPIEVGVSVGSTWGGD